MSQTKIYIACHRQATLPVLDNIYIPLQVGKAHSQIETDYLSDDSEDNISIKNPYYSELTGWYWIWKNQKCEIIGTNHYRRFFTTEKASTAHKIKNISQWIGGIYNKHYGLFYTQNVKKWQPRILNNNEIDDILKTYD